MCETKTTCNCKKHTCKCIKHQTENQRIDCVSMPADNQEGGKAIYAANSKRFIGILRDSAGAYGNSTGLFRLCETTHPLTELGIGTLDGKKVMPYQ